MTWDGLNPPYATIVADPPWPVDLDYGPRKGARFGTAAPYTVMTIWEICALPVRQLVGRNGHLYLWITPTLNRQGIGVQVARAWGFRIISEFIWDKARLGTGAFPRACHEVLLIGRRGVLPFQAPLNVRSVQQWAHPRGHSTKPPAALDVVEQASPGPYVDCSPGSPASAGTHGEPDTNMPSDLLE